MEQSRAFLDTEIVVARTFTVSSCLPPGHHFSGLEHCIDEIRAVSQVCRNVHQKEKRGLAGNFCRPQNGPRETLG